MFSRFLQFVAHINTSLLFMVEKYSIVCIYFILFIHSFIDGTGLFLPLVVVNNAAMNTGVQVSV